MKHLILLDLEPCKYPICKMLHNACRAVWQFLRKCMQLISLQGSHKEHQQPSEVTVLKSKLAEEPLVGSSLELLLHQLLGFLQQIIDVKLWNIFWNPLEHTTQATALAVIKKQYCHEGIHETYTQFVTQARYSCHNRQICMAPRVSHTIEIVTYLAGNVTKPLVWALTLRASVLLLLFSTASFVIRPFRSTSRVYRVGIMCW